MKRILTPIVAVSFCIIGSNFLSPYINIFTEGLFQSYYFQTENAEFDFLTMPSKGRDIEMMQDQFSDFKKENPSNPDLKLYRTFTQNPLKFWNWYTYYTHPRYSYPYMEQRNNQVQQ